MMKRLILILCLLVPLAVKSIVALADSRLIGSWESSDGERYDILDSVVSCVCLHTSTLPVVIEPTW